VPDVFVFVLTQMKWNFIAIGKNTRPASHKWLGGEGQG